MQHRTTPLSFINTCNQNKSLYSFEEKKRRNRELRKKVTTEFSWTLRKKVLYPTIQGVTHPLPFRILSCLLFRLLDTK